jgi:hypothetical protein
MLPPALVSVYKEYKKDTDSIASWLASTARECGYTSENLPAPKPKAKHRAGKKNKKKAPGDKPPYIIEIKDFVPLAEFISSYKKPALSVPKAFFNTLHRVIYVRSDFKDRLFQLKVKKDAASDARHTYFVSILIKVSEILKPFSDMPVSGSSDTVDRLTNKFEALKVYEPSQEFLNAADVERPAQAGNDKSTYEADPSGSLDDAMAAYYFMCRDLNEIRDFIQSIWQGIFHDEKGMGDDPAVLAVVTNIAIEFGTSIAEEVLPILDKYGGYLVVATHLVDALYSDEKGEREPLRKPSYDRFNQFYIHAATYLQTLTLVGFDATKAFFPERAFGVRDYETDWESKSDEQKAMEDAIILTELWFECLLLRNIPDYPCRDEFIRGVMEYRETKKIPFSLVFAAQVNLDIHNTIGGYVEKSVPLLIERIEIMNKHLNKAIESIKNVKSPHWSARDQKWLEDTQAGFDWFLADPFHTLRTLQVKQMGNAKEFRETLSKVDKWRILKRSPIIAGMVLYYHRAEMHEAGLKLTNAWGSIILPAHLYNAIKQEGASKYVWEDMETLWQIFGEEQFFAGGKPSDYSDYAKRFMLQIGISAATFHKDRLLRGSLGVEDFTKKGARFLVSRASIHRSLQDTYHRNQNRMSWSTESISAILSSAESEEKYKGKGKDRETDTPNAEEDVRVSPIGILKHLKRRMTGEVHELAWPYLQMHALNLMLLKVWRDECEPYFSDIYGENFKFEEWQLPFMCGHILGEAEGSLLDLAGAEFRFLHDANALAVCLRNMHCLSGSDFTLPESVVEKSNFNESEQSESDGDDSVLDLDEIQIPPSSEWPLVSTVHRFQRIRMKIADLPFQTHRPHLMGFIAAIKARDIDAAEYHVKCLEDATRSTIE